MGRADKRKRWRDNDPSEDHVGIAVSSAEEEKFERKLHDVLLQANAEEARSLLLSAAHGVAEFEIKNLTAVVVRFCLFRNAVAPGVPIKRKELLDKVAKGKSFSLILRIAISELASVYGIELKQLFRFSTVGTPTQDAVYVLKSLVPHPLLGLTVDEHERELAAVTLMVLSVVEVKGGKVEKEEFSHLLEQMGFFAGQSHLVFGQWEKTVLDVLLKRRYLMTVKGGNGNEDFYCLGENGRDEFSQDELNTFAARLVNVNRGGSAEKRQKRETRNRGEAGPSS